MVVSQIKSTSFLHHHKLKNECMTGSQKSKKHVGQYKYSFPSAGGSTPGQKQGGLAVEHTQTHTNMFVCTHTYTQIVITEKTLWIT